MFSIYCISNWQKETMGKFFGQYNGSQRLSNIRVSKSNIYHLVNYKHHKTRLAVACFDF